MLPVKTKLRSLHVADEGEQLVSIHDGAVVEAAAKPALGGHRTDQGELSGYVPQLTRELAPALGGKEGKATGNGDWLRDRYRIAVASSSIATAEDRFSLAARVLDIALFHREERPALERNIIDTPKRACANYRNVMGQHFGV